MMTRRAVSLIVLATSLTLCAQPTNQPREFSLRYSFKPLTLPKEPTVLRSTIVRIDERVESRLLRPLTLDLYLNESRESLEVLSARRGKSLFVDEFKYSLRDWGLQTPIYEMLDARFEQVGNWFSSFWRDTLSPNVERNNAQSAREVTFVEERATFYGIKKGIRPFSTSPYGFLSYGWRDSSDELMLETTLKASMRDWHKPVLSLITEVPLGKWGLGFGIEGRDGGDRVRENTRYGQLFTEVDRKVDITFGLKGPILGGLFSLGANVLGEQVLAFWSLDY